MGNFRDNEKKNLFSDNNIIGNINYFNIGIYRTYALNQLQSKEKSINKLFLIIKKRVFLIFQKEILLVQVIIIMIIYLKKNLKKIFLVRHQKELVMELIHIIQVIIVPGQYFINKHNDAFKKRHLKKYLLSNSIPFMSITERFNFSHSTINANSKNNNNLSLLKLKKQKENKLIQNNSFDLTTHSNTSNTNNQIKQMHGTFYNKEPRFKENDNKLKDLNPGPVAYINPFSNSGSSNIINFNGRFVDIRTGKNLILNNKRPTSYNNKYDYLIEKNNNLIPSVGKYNTGNNLTIEYKNIKK